MENEFPAPREFLTTVALYREYKFRHEEVWLLARILFWNGNYDSFCIECGRDSTFKVVSDALPKELNKYYHDQQERESETKAPLPMISDGIYIREAVCSRANGHKQCFVYRLASDIDFETTFNLEFSFEKIGQYPSFGDINIAKAKSYSGVLEKSLQKELSRAIGLASHDVGVGAYVYLRRVFEALVEEVHQEAASKGGWDEEQYSRSRMQEKISLLRGDLPRFLTEHPEMYALLSKGIHELSEEECLRNFEALKIGIELILDQRLEEKERRRKIDAASAAIKAAHKEASK